MEDPAEVAVGLVVDLGDSTAGVEAFVADSAAEAAFAVALAVEDSVVALADGASMGAFVAASEGMAASVDPSPAARTGTASSLALVSRPGSIGRDRITAITDIPITRIPSAIHIALTPAIRMPTILIPITQMAPIPTIRT